VIDDPRIGYTCCMRLIGSGNEQTADLALPGPEAAKQTGLIVKSAPL
jgi:hypothetical protein